MNSQNKFAAQGKATYALFSLGENVLDGWEAKPLGGNKFLIKRADNTEVELSCGQQTKAGEVSIDKNGNISVGKWTVVVGVNLLKGWEAKSTRGKGNYFVRRSDGSHFNLKLGEMIEGQGIPELDEYQNIKIGESSIRVAKKEYELTLLVFKAQERNGFISYFNYIEPKNKNNRKDGTKGIFYPSKDGKKPAQFCETGPDGFLYSTAVFWPSSDKSFVCGKIRSINDAIKEKNIYEKIKELEKEAKEIGVEPDEIFGYSELNRELKDINENSWQEKPFTISVGHAMFRVKEKNKEQEVEPQP